MRNGKRVFTTTQLGTQTRHYQVFASPGRSEPGALQRDGSAPMPEVKSNQRVPANPAYAAEAPGRMGRYRGGKKSGESKVAQQLLEKLAKDKVTRMGRSSGSCPILKGKTMALIDTKVSVGN